MRLSTRSELLDKIRLGEDSFIEFKEATFSGARITGPRQDSIADELAAFANSGGGELLLGVEDKSRDVVGIPLDRLDDVEALVRQASTQSVNPPLAVVIERLRLPNALGDEVPLLRVGVPRSLFVHHSPGGYLHRVGSAKLPLPPDQLARLFAHRSQSRMIRFDETPVARASLGELRTALWRRFAPTNTSDTDEVLLRKLAMAAPDDEDVVRPTVAGLLMAGSDARAHLPNAFVQAVAYRGTAVPPAGDPHYQLDAEDIAGPLDEQIAGACAFVRRNMRVAAEKHEEGGRIDLPQYSMRAVFEAVTNAVAHRDYSMHGSKVRLRMFSDRLEIFTPGMLPNTMTTDSLAWRQAARNEAVTSLLARCPMPEADLSASRRQIMDRRGEGVPVILDESEQLSGRRPQYRLIDDSELLLTIFAANPEPTP